MTHPRSSWLPGSVKATSQRLHWLSAGLGIVVVGASAFLLLGQPMESVSRLGAHRTGDQELPMALRQDAGASVAGRMRVLTGVNGETFAPGAGFAMSEELLPHGDTRNIAPAALEDVSDASCLTVTTEDGKKLSFRILGVRPEAKAKPANAAPEVELAIAGCAHNGKAVAKAVIEPDATPAAKNTAVPERSL